jgi:hypothetical protein
VLQGTQYTALENPCARLVLSALVMLQLASWPAHKHPATLLLLPIAERGMQNTGSPTTATNADALQEFFRCSAQPSSNSPRAGLLGRIAV